MHTLTDTPPIDLALWAGVDRLVDRAPSLDDLRSHRLHLLAAHRWRRLGHDVPRMLAVEELMATARTISTDALVHQIADVLDQPLMVIKGPAIAALYPEPSLRWSHDLDILVEDSAAAQRQLVAAGFEPIGYPDEYYRGLHHERPLSLPNSHAPHVEIHSRCNWVHWASAPRFADLEPLAVSTEREEVRHPAAAAHVLIVAAHSWGSLPMRRVSDLVDIAALRAAADPAEIAAIAERWGLQLLWHTMSAAADAMILGGTRTLPLRTWARDIFEVRDRSVLEGHVHRWFGPYWALPAVPAIRETGITLFDELTPAPGEGWSDKMQRIGKGMRHPMASVTQHNAELGSGASRPRHRNRDSSR